MQGSETAGVGVERPVRITAHGPRPAWSVALLALLVTTWLWLSWPVGTQAQVPSPSVLWFADHEEGTTADWWLPGPVRVEGTNCGGEYPNGPASSAVSSAAHTGHYGLALRVPDMATGSSIGARAFRWCEARQHGALYYSAWYYIPRQVRVDFWWWLMEWKSLGSFNAKFGLAVGNRPDGQMYVYLERGQDSVGGTWEQSVKNLPVGQWFHLEAYYLKAMDGTGRVTVWQDGTQIIDLGGVQTANGADLGWAVINYGQYTVPSDVTIYVDDAAISTTRLGPGGGMHVATPTPTQTTTATPTLAPTPTVTPRALAACSVRPPVLVSAVRGTPGSLEVRVVAPTPPGLATNRLRELRFEETANAQVDVRGRIGTAGRFTVDLPDRPHQVSFTVRRADATRGATVQLDVVDDCGPWSTFVGGGPGAF